MNEELKLMRKNNGETQSQIANLLGLKTASAYCKKENGFVPFSIGEIIILADHFNKPVSFFINQLSCEERVENIIKYL